MSVDFKILPAADFSATEVTIQALTSRARDSICGGISFTTPKSTLPSVAAQMVAKGYTYELG